MTDRTLAIVIEELDKAHAELPSIQDVIRMGLGSPEALAATAKRRAVLIPLMKEMGELALAEISK